jgi:hypothetical protein
MDIVPSNAGTKQARRFQFSRRRKVPAKLTPTVAEDLARTLKIETLMRGNR